MTEAKVHTTGDFEPTMAAQKAEESRSSSSSSDEDSGTTFLLYHRRINESINCNN
jgi:hypothetical protein